MFFSREYDYALRMMRVLIKNEQATVGTICTSEHIPQPYAYKIIKKLEKAELTKGIRGPNGGYQLAADPRSITFYDVYVAIEGCVYLSDCMQEGYVCPNYKNGCTIHKELKLLQNQFIQGMKEHYLIKALEEEI